MVINFNIYITVNWITAVKQNTNNYDNVHLFASFPSSMVYVCRQANKGELD